MSFTALVTAILPVGIRGFRVSPRCHVWPATVLWPIELWMVDNLQAVVASKGLAPIIERRKGWRNVAAFVRQRVTHLERSLARFRSPHKACSCQITEGGTEHLLGDAWNLATELCKTARAISERRQNDCAPTSAERGQGDVHAAHVEPVTHTRISTTRALTSWLVLFKVFEATNNRTETCSTDP
jgi:hypothetical protein